jgi:hypothetical protein
MCTSLWRSLGILPRETGGTCRGQHIPGRGPAPGKEAILPEASQGIQPTSHGTGPTQQESCRVPAAKIADEL